MISGPAPRPELESLYRAMRNDLRAFIRRRVRDEAAADDLVHDVFLRIHAGRDRVKDPARLTSWIYRIARNAVVDWHRRRRSAERREIAEADEVAVTEEPEQMLARFAPAARRLINELPPIYREAILEVDLGGESQRSLARRLGIAESTLKSRVQRGRRMVEAKIRDCCHLEFDRRGGLLDWTPRHGCCRCEELAANGDAAACAPATRRRTAAP